MSIGLVELPPAPNDLPATILAQERCICQVILDISDILKNHCFWAYFRAKFIVMAHIFLDESGDLGFNFKKKKTSKFFIVTFLFIEGSKGPIEKIVKKTHSELAKKTQAQSRSTSCS